jgi:hypothetical protein
MVRQAEWSVLGQAEKVGTGRDRKQRLGKQELGKNTLFRLTRQDELATDKQRTQV